MVGIVLHQIENDFQIKSSFYQDYIKHVPNEKTFLSRYKRADQLASQAGLLMGEDA